MTLMRCGLARLSDLQTGEWKQIFELLEVHQNQFSSHSLQFLSPDYSLPRDPLHIWSRCWEYPYVYLNMVKWADNIGSDSSIHIVDVGSGVTFFPFSLASHGFHITCTDLDPIVERNMIEAIHHIPHSPGQVDFKFTDGECLPFDNCTIDAVYCISVLEHISLFEPVISEMARILRPGGALFLTFDLDLRGDHEIGTDKYYVLKLELSKYFDFLHPEISVHPVDILTSTSGPYGYIQRTKLIDKFWFFLKQKLIKPLIGQKPELEVPYYLTVEGLAMIRKKEK